MLRNRTVMLFSPQFVAESAQSGAGYRATPPLSHLALAGPLREAGYSVRIVDTKWDSDWRRLLREEIDDLACVGITSLTGPAVRNGLEISAFARSLNPRVPIIWGGWHSTFAAQQAIEDPLVDVVVRGMGERTLIEVLQALSTGSSLRGIPGVHAREDGEMLATPDRDVEDINHFPPPAYDLIDPARYITKSSNGVRMAATIFSRGCPFACDFCLDSRNKWLGLGVDRMIADMKFWIDRGANHIRFYDGNFFLGRPRIVEFCNAILKNELQTKVRWIATAVGNRVVQMDDDLLALLKRSGLTQVAIGAESGSDELLARITNKTTTEATLDSVRRLTRHGINQYLFFMVGYPDEPASALEETLELALRAKQINPNVELFLNFTTPLPGSEVFRIAVERGYVEAPRVFADWARFDYLRPNLLPITPKYERIVNRFQRYLGFAFPSGTRGPLASALKLPIRKAAQWRLKRGYYDFPLEIAASNTLHTAAKAVSRLLRVE